jgi:hypothetical protein
VFSTILAVEIISVGTMVRQVRKVEKSFYMKNVFCKGNVFVSVSGCRYILLEVAVYSWYELWYCRWLWTVWWFLM